MAGESAAGPAPLSLGFRGRRYPVVLPSVRDPRLRLSAVIATLHVLGQTSFGFQLSIAQILLTVGTAGALEAAIVFWRRRMIVWPASALVTGNGIAFILRVPGTHHGDWWSLRGAWIFAGTAALGVLSKYVIRLRGRHVFNPSNVALVVTFLVLGSTRTEPQYLWWGPMTVWLALALGVIGAGALGILWQLGLLRIALGFWLAFAAGVGVLVLGGHAMTARWHLGPLTGFSLWTLLVTSPEVFVFLCFMITDPRTSPRGSGARWRYATAVGLLAALLIAPQTTEFATKVAILAALTIVCAVAPIMRWLGARSAEAAWRGSVAAAARQMSLAARAGAGFAGAAGCAGVLLLAGLSSRAPAAPAVRLSVSPQALPAVTVAPAVGVVAISHSTALAVTRELLVDLRTEQTAVSRRSVRLAAAVTTGAELRRLRGAIAAEASGTPAAASSYDVRSVRLALVPGSDQAAPLIFATVQAHVADATYAGAQPRLISKGAVRSVSEQFRMRLVGGTYAVASVRAASAGASSTTPSKTFTVTLAAGRSLPEGEPLSVRLAVRLRQKQKYSQPATVALTISGPGGPTVRFARVGLIVAPGQASTGTASVTPSEWYPGPGSYRIAASVGGQPAGTPLQFKVTAPQLTIPRFENVAKSSGIVGSVPTPTCGQFVTTPAWGRVGPQSSLALFVPRLGGAAQLFVQTPPGHFADVARTAGVAVRDATAAAFGDYLNNGRQDLFVARYGAPSLLFRNDGNGHFTDVTASSGIAGASHASSVTWVDYDNDGRLDLYVTNYMTCEGRWTSGTDSLARVRYHGARLFRNDGDGHFTDVSVVLPENPSGAGLAASWFDATGDGRQDLYLGNDNVGQEPDHNRLYMNGGRTFRDTSLSSGTAFYMNTMGIGVGDFEHNGRLDLALSNIGGNVLLMNRGNGVFAAAPASMGVTRSNQFGSYPSVTWGVGAYDFTDDGWQDLYFTAGNVNPKLTPVEGQQPSELFLNDGGRRFLDVSAPSGAASAGDVKGAAFADWLGDGRVGMFVLAQGGAGHLYRNVTPLGGNHWLEVQAVGTVSNRDGCGARVTARAGGVTQVGEILCAQNEQTVQFGLGPASTVSTLTIVWPSGIRQVLRDVRADRYLTVTEPRRCVVARVRSARC